MTVTTQALPIVGINGNTPLSVGSTISLSPNTGGTWVSSNSGIATVTNNGLVTGVAVGQVNFTFNSLNGCSNTTDFITVTKTVIIANDDDYKTPINSAIGGEIKDIISNDLLNGQPVVSTDVIISLVNPSSNVYNFTIDNNGNFSIPEGVAAGSYQVEYQICDKLNPTICATAFVLFTVLDPCDFDGAPSNCDLIVHNAISPDDASFNKIFIIEGIEKFANNKVEIYNRWGVLVYQVEGYDNNQKSFNGFSEGRSTIKQIEKLPEGTYYYTIQYVKNNGLTKKLAGFLFIER